MTPEEAMTPVLAAVDDAAHEAWKGGDHGDFPAKRAAVWDAIAALVVYLRRRGRLVDTTAESSEMTLSAEEKRQTDMLLKQTNESEKKR